MDYMNNKLIKGFVIVVVPCLAGSKYGYIARYSKYQFWAKTRIQVLTDMIAFIYQRNEKHV